MSAGITQVVPTGRLNQASQLIALLDRSEGQVRRRFLRLVQRSGTLESLETVAGLLETGQVDAALTLLTEDLAPSLATSLDQVFTASGTTAAEVLRSQVDTLFDFNAANSRAVEHMRRERLRLVREFNAEQRLATNVFLQEATAAGAAPVTQARQLKRSIGLTRHQAQSVVNFRRLLEARDPAALTRALRDRRFDSSVSRAITSRTPLTRTQINRQVERYRERFIAFRAQTIAETETLSAANAADDLFWQEAVAEGQVDVDELTNVWRTSMRENRRPSHRAMEGQQRRLGVAFTSGDGNSLRFPGDPLAPASDRIRCKCVVARTLGGQSASRSRRR